MVRIPFPVPPEDHGARLDVFLTRKITRLTRNKASRLIRAGLVEKEPSSGLTKPSQRVFEGEVVILTRQSNGEKPPDDIIIPVVYEDPDLLAVNKPGDVVVHPTASAYHRTLIRVLRTRRSEFALDLAHRIDKETSGIVLLSRTSRAQKYLSVQFRDRLVKKSYLAIVQGVIAQEQFQIEKSMKLKPDSLSNCLMEISEELTSLPAVTDIEVLARGKNASLVCARPHTGRQHQIRLHLQSIGHPIVGDKLYLGGEELFLDAVNHRISKEDLTRRLGHFRHALHAFELSFTHPESKEYLCVRAPLPADLNELLNKLIPDVVLPGL